MTTVLTSPLQTQLNMAVAAPRRVLLAGDHSVNGVLPGRHRNTQNCVQMFLFQLLSLQWTSVKDKGTHVLMADVSTFQAASCACAIQDMYLDETIGVSM